MIKHIVGIKLNDYERLTELEKEFKGLANHISEIKEISSEKNVYLERETNYDIMFSVMFNTIEEMAAYLIHPVHVEFGKKLKGEYAEKIMTIDLEG